MLLSTTLSSSSQDLQQYNLHILCVLKETAVHSICFSKKSIIVKLLKASLTSLFISTAGDANTFILLFPYIKLPTHLIFLSNLYSTPISIFLTPLVSTEECLECLKDMKHSMITGSSVSFKQKAASISQLPVANMLFTYRITCTNI